HECGVADEIGDAVAGMSRRREHFDLELPEREALAIAKQALELAAIGRESGPEVVDFPEGLLHRGDAGADADRRGRALVQMAGRREVVRMSVSIEDPAQLESLMGD